MKKVLILLFSIGICYAQQIDKPLDLPSTFEQSAAVFNGVVAAKNSYWDVDRKMIYTVHKVQVSTSFKGDAEKFRYVMTKGGTVGLEGLIVKPSVRLAKNTSGYFMVKEVENITLEGFSHNDQLMELIRGLDGFFDYDIQTDRVQLPGSHQTSKRKFERAIKNLSKKKPKSVDVSIETEIFSQSFFVTNGIQITNVSPTTIVAGNAEVLTIAGNGFGEFELNNSFGVVSFRDADTGGLGWIESLKTHIVSWTDTEIKVKVPSNSGSGSFRITRSDNTSYQSTQTITIPFSVSTVIYSIDGSSSNDLEYPIFHAGSMQDDVTTENPINQDNVIDGAYRFVLNTTFSENESAKESFDTALRDWVCTTGLNFEIIEETTEIESSALDFMNIVNFGSTNALAVTYSYYTGCIIGDVVNWTWTDVDIIFNDTIDWGYETVSNSQYDFSSTAKHELGHALGFGHTIDEETLMHYAVGGGVGPVSITPYLSGAEIILARDISTSFCGVLDPHVVSECSSLDPTLDSDGDGLTDIFDDCPNTTMGDSIDVNGCGLSQLDSDEDGVSDDIDLCDNTPAGAVVDASGCADTDVDGIYDNVDLCPDTPDGAEIDSDGCAEFQKDSDGDGVSDDFDLCNATPENTDVDAYGCSTFLLAPDNFNVVVTSNSCIDTNDGSIYVSANNQSLQYQVEINGSQHGLNSNYGFSKTIDNLGIGVYPVCFSVIGQTDFQQCFTVVLSQPDPLSVLAALSNSGEQVSLTLSGSDSYQIEHNGLTKTISAENLNVPLFKGLNTIRITTDLDCQGIFEENYFNSEDILVYPNATKNELKVVIGGADEEAQFIVRDLRGLTLMRMTKNLANSRTSTINLGGYAKGVYFIEVNSPTVRQTTKILKND